MHSPAAIEFTYKYELARARVCVCVCVCVCRECAWAPFHTVSWIYGAVVYSGHDTKVGQNKLATVPTTKRTALDRRINLATALVFGLQLVVIIVLGMLGNATMTEQKPTVCSPWHFSQCNANTYLTRVC